MALNKPLNLKNMQTFGVFPALITPFLDNGQIDFRKYEMLIHDLINIGVNGLCAVVTTSQDSTMNFLEQVSLASRTYNIVDGRVPLIFGAGSNNTKEAMDLTSAIEDALGPSTFLHATGYKNNPPQAGLRKHYEQLASTHPQSTFIMYSVSSRTSSRIEPETQVYLMTQVPNIIGIKLAEPSMKDKVPWITESIKGHGVVVSGEDDMVAYIMSNGGTGVISASACVAPQMFIDMTRAALLGRYEEAERIQKDALPIVDAVFCKKNPIPLAYMFRTNVRLPLVNLDQITDAQGRPEPARIKSLGMEFRSGVEAVDHVLGMYTAPQLGIDLSRYRDNR